MRLSASRDGFHRQTEREGGGGSRGAGGRGGRWGGKGGGGEWGRKGAVTGTLVQQKTKSANSDNNLRHQLGRLDRTTHSSRHQALTIPSFARFVRD